MSRNLRLESPTDYYHVMQRGVGKQILFEDDGDYQRYINKLKECKSELDFKVAIYLNNTGLADTKSILEFFGSIDSFKEYHSLNCEQQYLDCETDLATCDKGLEIIRKHYGTEFENTLIVKQLCKSERDKIIHEMKKAGLSLKRIELLTGVSKTIIRRVQ